MQRLVLATLDSQVEFATLAHRIPPHRPDFHKLIQFTCDLDALRNASELKRTSLNPAMFNSEIARRWIGGPGDGLKIYTGRLDEPRRGPARIWAAVEIADGLLNALIKTSAEYRGVSADHAARLADARNRCDHGARLAWR